MLAEVEPEPKRRTLFARLAVEADGQAQIWVKKAAEAGERLPSDYRATPRVRLVAALARALGPERMRTALAAMKVRGLSVYRSEEPGHPMPTSLEEVGRRHRSGLAGGNLRAAVFGVNDGLVSNASLILGVAGAAAQNGVILLSGAAGLLAGAFSMAAGEWVSVRTQREMFEHQIAAEREELAQYPAEEAEELALIYEARGVPKDEAAQMAKRIVADPKSALDTLAREELGVTPETLSSPWGAATFSFLSFAAGALVPLAPFLVVSGRRALEAAIALSAVALFGVGATMSLFTGRRALWSGVRMLLIGSAAGAATFWIGHLLGVRLS